MAKQLLFAILLTTTGIQFTHAANASECALPFKRVTAGFEKDYLTILEAGAAFKKLSKGSPMQFGDGVNSFKSIPENSLVVADILLDGFGRCELVRGRFVKAAKNSITVDVNGKFRQLNTEPGIGGIISLGIMPGREVKPNEGFEKPFDTTADSELEFNRLTKKAFVIEIGRDSRQQFYKLVPLGSLVMISRLTDGYGRGQIVKGLLVRVGNNFVDININGSIKRFSTEAGVGGIMNLAVVGLP